MECVVSSGTKNEIRYRPRPELSRGWERIENGRCHSIGSAGRGTERTATVPAVAVSNDRRLLRAVTMSECPSCIPAFHSRFVAVIIVDVPSFRRQQQQHRTAFFSLGLHPTADPHGSVSKPPFFRRTLRFYGKPGRSVVRRHWS